MRFLPLFLSLLLLNACGTFDHYKVDSSVQETLNSWNGLHVDALYVKIGLPTKKERLSDSRILMTYRSETNPPSTKGGSDKYYCIVNFLVNNNNKIITAKLIDRREPPWGNYLPCRKIVVTSY